eukprot:8565597-Karenia_brevis.AAC.1
MSNSFNSSDGGVYVGKGGHGVACCVFWEKHGQDIDGSLAYNALGGRRLYVFREEVDAARNLIDWFRLGRPNLQPALTLKDWHRLARQVLSSE